MTTTEQRFNPIIAFVVIAFFVSGILALIIGWQISIVILGLFLVLTSIGRFAVVKKHLPDTILTVIGVFCFITAGICGLALESTNNIGLGLLCLGLLFNFSGTLTTYRKQN